MNKTGVLKRLDALLGRLLVRCLPTQPLVQCVSRRTFLFVRPGGIGDAVLLIPILNAVKKQFPDATIDVLAEKRNAQIFRLSETVSETFHYDIPGELFSTLRRRYDVIVDTEQWHRLSAIVTRLVRSSMNVGFATNERKRMFSHAVDYSHERYEMESFAALLGPLGVPWQGSEPGPFLVVPDSARDHVRQWLDGLDGRDFITLFPGASIPERRWSHERFRAVAEWCIERGYGVVVVGGPQDREEGDLIAAGGDVVNLAGETSLVETAAVLARSATLVSGDSGLLHLAVGLNVPTVSLFGPGIAAKWAPRGERHIVLKKNLPCSPCTKFGYTPPCPIQAQCMRDISSADVIAALGTSLDHHRVEKRLI